MTIKELIAKLQAIVADGLSEDTVVGRFGPMPFKGMEGEDVVALPFRDNQIMLMPVRDSKMAAAFKARAEAYKEAKLKEKM